VNGLNGQKELLVTTLYHDNFVFVCTYTFSSKITHAKVLWLIRLLSYPTKCSGHPTLTNVASVTAKESTIDLCVVEDTQCERVRQVRGVVFSPVSHTAVQLTVLLNRYIHRLHPDHLTCRAFANSNTGVFAAIRMCVLTLITIYLLTNLSTNM